MTRKKESHSADGVRKTERRSLILNLFRELPNNKFSLKHLASASGGASKEGRRETLAILDGLIAEGIIEECARAKYRLTSEHLPHVEGVASMTAGGALYVRVEGEEQDLFVNQRNALNALDGDRVEVVILHRGHDGRAEGEVTRVVERSRRPYIGVADVDEHRIFVRPDARRLPMDIYLHKREYPDLRDGEKVAVRVVEWLPGSKSLNVS